MKPGDIIIFNNVEAWLEADGRRYEASGNDFFPGICGRKAQCF